MKLIDLKRNDVNGAVKFYKQQVKNGKWDTDQAALLFRLQDNPTRLQKEIATRSNKESRK
jgi:hypothetical protein